MCSIFSAASTREVDFYVQLLDGNKKAFSLPGNHKGQDLLRAVLNSIGVPEQQFFGLRYQDSRKTLQWVNVRKSVHSLVKCCRGGLSDLVGEKSCQLFLAIRFYPNDPCRELSETTRLQVFLQTIQDIQSGAVVVPRDKAPRLAALMLQSYHGDFDHQMGFPLNNYSLFADLRPGIDSEVASMYRMFKGLPASRAEYQFLSHVKWLEGYGRLDDGSLSTLCIETTGIVLRSQSAASGSQACFFWPRIKKFQLKKHRMVMKVRSK
uniref:FERM domain-containing protein n=1 Tax=Macrostomum lignano TaxID=282301 RepID=A0A1I8FRF2_9PLAT